MILAILADFGAAKPEEVIRQILQHLLKLIGRVPRLKKYKNQLRVLSRLRKLEIPAKKEIESMPIHYNIETDGLYLEGIEQGISDHRRETVIRMLKAQKYKIEEISLIAEVPETFIRIIVAEFNVEI